MNGESEVDDLHARLLTAWNDRDARAYASLFRTDATMVGFDGSTIVSSAAIEAHLSGIFADHEPARYVRIVRELRAIGPGVELLRADVGMIPPGADGINPETNAVQSLLAVHEDGTWSIAHFQNTPARFDGRPDAADALTAELSEAASS